MITTRNIITLDSSLEEMSRYRNINTEEFLSDMSYKTKGKVLHHDIQNNEGIHSSFLYFISDAYSLHRKITITPQDLWYVVISEISRSVNEHPESYRRYFSTNKDKVEIVLHTDSVTELPLDSLLTQLKSLVPININLFIPKFSTETPQSRLAMLASFAGTVKSYYSYMTFCCGISAIELLGTRDDWELFVDTITELHDLFKKDSLSSYLEKILVRVSMIRDIYLGGSSSFFKDIFTSENIGSGGELLINGWFGNDFFVSPGDLPKINNFPNTWSVVPYKNINSDRNFSLVMGCFSHNVVDRFRRVNYNSVIIEHEKQ